MCGTKEMMQPCLLCRRAISLVARTDLVVERSGRSGADMKATAVLKLWLFTTAFSTPHNLTTTMLTSSWR